MSTKSTIDMATTRKLGKMETENSAANIAMIFTGIVALLIVFGCIITWIYWIKHTPVLSAQLSTEDLSRYTAAATAINANIASIFKLVITDGLMSLFKAVIASTLAYIFVRQTTAVLYTLVQRWSK